MLVRTPSRSGPSGIVGTAATSQFINRRRVVQHLLDNDSLSRADIARSTGLTPATVSAIVAMLEHDNLVRDADLPLSANRVGKPPRMLRINPDAYRVAAITLGNSDLMHTAIVNLAGEIVHSNTHEIDGRTGDGIVDLVIEAVRSLTDFSPRPLSGVGIAVPGVVAEPDTVTSCANLGWSGVPLSNLVSDATNLPAFIANTANLAALAEHRRLGGAVDNLAAILIDSTVSAGFIVNGQLRRGIRNFSGEIEHLKVESDGPRCYCGHNGCLSTYLSLPALSVARSDSDNSTQSLAASKLALLMGAMTAILDTEHFAVFVDEDSITHSFKTALTEELEQQACGGMFPTPMLSILNAPHSTVLQGAASFVQSRLIGSP